MGAPLSPADDGESARVTVGELCGSSLWPGVGRASGEATVASGFVVVDPTFGTPMLGS